MIVFILKLALGISDTSFKRGFSVFLVIVAVRLWWQTMQGKPVP